MPIVIIFSFSTQFANFLFQDGDYYRAITEYKRVLDCGIDVDTGAIMEKIGLSYALSDKYKLALPYIASAYQFKYNEKIKREYVWILLKNKKWDEAYFLTEDDGDSLLKIYRGIALIQKGQFKKGKVILSELLPKKMLPDEGNVDKIVSYIIPGSGQILSGNIRSGIVSMAINFGLGYFAYRAILGKDGYSAILLSLNLWRFYKGSVKLMNSIIKKKNEKKIGKVLIKYTPYNRKKGS